MDPTILTFTFNRESISFHKMAQRETTGPNGHTFATLLLMVQKSGVHQLSLVVYPCLSHYLQGFSTIPGG